MSQGPGEGPRHAPPLVGDCPPQGLGATTYICKAASLSPAPPVSLCPQAGSAHPPSMYTLLWMSRAPWVWAPMAGGGGRLRVH